MTNTTASKPKLPHFDWRDRCKPISHEEALANKVTFDRIDADKATSDLGVMNKTQNIESLKSRSGIPNKYLKKTFDNYHVSDHRQLSAHNICKEYANNFKGKLKSGSITLLAGGANTGKTHLACAIANHIISSQGKVIYTTFAEMIRKIKSPWNTKNISEQEIIDEFSSCLLLIIDEIGIQFGTDFEKNSLFEIIDNRSSHPLPAIMISNHSMADIKGFIGDRVVSRIKRTAGQFLPFEWKSYKPNKTINNKVLTH